MSMTVPMAEQQQQQKQGYAYNMASPPMSPVGSYFARSPASSPARSSFSFASSPSPPPSPSPSPRRGPQMLQLQRMKLQANSASRRNAGMATPPGQAASSASTPRHGGRQRSNPMVVVGMLFAGLLFALLIMALFAYAPFFCGSWFALMYMIGLYLSTESNWRWHDAQEFENRFWTMTAFLFSSAVLYIHDSPLAVGRWNSSIGMFLVVSFTGGVHFLDRFVHRQEISRKPRFNTRDQVVAQNLFKYKATAEEKTSLVSECVNRIDRMVLPSTINNMINYSQVKLQEQKIFRLLAGASKDELNYILTHIRLALLFYKVKDHSRHRADQSRTLIMDLLCKTRLPDLSVTSRAILLDALMVMKISAHPQGEKWVRNIILKTSGDDLSNLKSYSDAKGDFHSVHKLVYNDIRSADIRKDILNHIRREAGVQTAHMRLGTKRAMKRRQHAWRKVLSDVDDTLYSSGGRYPAGIDMRYPRHAVYPGVLDFYRELDMGTAGPDEWTSDREGVGNLVFLSARPHVYKDVSEKKSYAKFAAFHEHHGMHTLPTMLAGNLKSGRAFMVQGDLEPMAQKKYENFAEFYQLYPEFTHIFVGDNGQGDVRAAELIVENHGSEALEAAFFQLVQPVEKTFGYHSHEDIERWRSMNIVFFHTYVGAAVEAFLMQKLRLKGLRKVAVAATANFEALAGWPTPEHREHIRVLLNNDLERANQLLINGTLDAVPLLQRPQMFALNTDVRTPFGRGIVRKYRGVDGMYVVDLVSWNGGVKRSQRRRSAQGYFTEENMVPFVYGDSTPIMRSPASYVRMYKAPLLRVYAPNTIVTTPYGVGRVVRFRPEDEIYVVAIDGGSTMLNMTGYFTPDSVYAAASDKFSTGSDSSPRMFAGVRSGLGYITKRLSTFVPGGGAKPLFSVGTAVETPFGSGVVLQMREHDRVYKIRVLRVGRRSTTSISSSPALDSKNSISPEISAVTSSMAGSIDTIMMAWIHEGAITFSNVSPPRSFLSLLGLGLGSGNASVDASGRHVEGNMLPLPPTSEGSLVATPYGKGVVKRYRNIDSVYEVALTDLACVGDQHVMAFLTEPYVRAQVSSGHEIPAFELSNSNNSSNNLASTPRSGIFQLFRYGFNSSSSHEIQDNTTNEQTEVPRRVETPFGVGETLSNAPPRDYATVTLENPDLAGVVAYVQNSEVIELVTPVRRRRNTLDLLGYPFTYLRGSWTGTPPSSEFGHLLPRRPAFVSGALVASPFGDGVVVSYRSSDAIYVVRIQRGDLLGYFQASSLSHPVRGVIGDPVDTRFGSGILKEVRSFDGVHVVCLRHDAEMKIPAIYMYLQPRTVLSTLRAARGDLVTTPFGMGVVVRYRASDGFYCVALEWNKLGKDAANTKNSKTNDSTSRQERMHIPHVKAYIRASDVTRVVTDGKAASGCAVM